RAICGEAAVAENQSVIPRNCAVATSASIRQGETVLRGTRLPVGCNKMPRSLSIHVVAAVTAIASVHMPIAARQSPGPLRSEVRADNDVVAAGRTFSADAGARILAAGGNAIDAGVASVFAAAVVEISHFGLGGEAPIIIYSAKDKRVVVINGQ